MLTYTKLWILLEKRGMKKTDLKEIISGNTLAKLGKNETVSSIVIEKICAFLDCQPGDIMEYVSDKQIQKVVDQLGTLQQMTMNSLKATGMNEEQIKGLMNEALTMYMDGMFTGNNPFKNFMEQAIKNDENEEDQEEE